MNLHEIQNNLKQGFFRLSIHAENEAEVENIQISQLITSILQGEILENYEDTGRGESCLILGFDHETPIHSVCGLRGENVIIVTVYIPKMPKFIDPWTRNVKNE